MVAYQGCVREGLLQGAEERVAVGDCCVALWRLFPSLLFLWAHGDTTAISETPFSDELNRWTRQRENL